MEKAYIKITYVLLSIISLCGMRLSVSPSLSFDNMSIGVNYSTFFKRMSPNPYLTFSADF